MNRPVILTNLILILEYSNKMVEELVSDHPTRPTDERHRAPLFKLTLICACANIQTTWRPLFHAQNPPIWTPSTPLPGGLSTGGLAKEIVGSARFRRTSAGPGSTAL